eukprot:2063203-Prymnesium_polylepis.2
MYTTQGSAHGSRPARHPPRTLRATHDNSAPYTCAHGVLQPAAKQEQVHDADDAAAHDEAPCLPERLPGQRERFWCCVKSIRGDGALLG